MLFTTKNSDPLLKSGRVCFSDGLRKCFHPAMQMSSFLWTKSKKLCMLLMDGECYAGSN